MILNTLAVVDSFIFPSLNIGRPGPKITENSITEYKKTKLCKALPLVLDDVIKDLGNFENQNTVFTELAAISPDIMKSLYLLAFKTYDGFEKF